MLLEGKVACRSELGLRNWFVAQQQKFGSLQRQEADCATYRIQKLDLKSARRIDLYHSADLPGGKTILWPILKERHHIKKFYRAVLHIIYLTRNN